MTVNVTFLFYKFKFIFQKHVQFFLFPASSWRHFQVWRQICSGRIPLRWVVWLWVRHATVLVCGWESNTYAWIHEGDMKSQRSQKYSFSKLFYLSCWQVSLSALHLLISLCRNNMGAKSSMQWWKVTILIEGVMGLRYFTRIFTLTLTTIILHIML